MTKGELAVDGAAFFAAAKSTIFAAVRNAFFCGGGKATFAPSSAMFCKKGRALIDRQGGGFACFFVQDLVGGAIAAQNLIFLSAGRV